MPGDDRTVARTIAVIVLMSLAIIALRGYLPGAEPPSEPREPETGPGSLVPVVAMLALSIAVVAISLLAQIRRRPTHAGAAEPVRALREGRLRLRALLLVAVALFAWLLLFVQLLRWAAPPAIDQPPPAEPGGEAAPGTGTDAVLPEAPADGGGALFGIFAATTIVLLVMTIVATLIGRTRVAAPVSVPVDPAGPVPPGAADPDLARAAELGLAEISDPTRGAREAIIACYAAMERELAKRPGTIPQDSDTPSEVLARAVERNALRAGSATELVDLFEEARFSRHVMDECHRADAERALRLVQTELQGAP